MVHGARPLGRSLSDFQTAAGPHGLMPGEAALVACAGRGELCDLAAEAPDDPRVRGAFIRFLALGGDANTPVHAYGVSLTGAQVTGPLDFTACRDVLPIELSACAVDETIALTDAQLRAFYAHWCALAGGVTGRRARVTGALSLADTKVAPSQNTTAIDLHEAEIGASLKLKRCAVQGRPAVVVDGAQVGGDVVFNHTAINGEVRLLDAKIGAGVLGQGCTLTNDDGYALSCDRASVGGDLHLRGKAKITGEVRLLGARIEGDVEASGSTLSNKSGRALNCDRASVGGNVHLRAQATVTGTVALVAARVQGSIHANGSHFYADGRLAVCCERAGVEAVVDLRHSTFWRLYESPLRTKRETKQNFSNIAEIVPRTAHSGIPLHIFAHVIPANDILDFQDAAIGGTLRLDSVRDNSVKIPGHIDGGIDLRGASVRYLSDRLAEAPSRPSTIRLDHLTYERFVEDSTLDVDKRLEWLMLQPEPHTTRDFRPQPFEQLAAVYARMGHEDRRRTILLEKHKRQTRALHRLYKLPERAVAPWSFASDARVWRQFAEWGNWTWERLRNPMFLLKFVFFEGLIGYGYRIAPLFALFFYLWILSTIMYTTASDAGNIVPTDSRIVVHERTSTEASCDGPWTHCDIEVLEPYTEFSAALYSLDILLPVVGLEQQADWRPTGLGLNIWKWLNILYGWLAGLMLVALVSGVVQRT